MKQLNKKGYSLARRCPFCGKADEIQVHLLVLRSGGCGLLSFLYLELAGFAFSM